ncbi:hypothetical protein Cgig2_007811 [Carnegiea gigantea]|uniref:VAN3-binding protein n=1 Tax=Carnegiea gigantea TaxID=171969 RepID=A0A9Q1GV45_9CARY|nr:hypothetical protein Cgig2_007811 [Carnegiea gigantea]
MDLDNLMLSTVSEAHPETLDFLSQTWCNFAVQALQPESQNQSPILLQDSAMKLLLEGDMRPSVLKMDHTTKMDDADYTKSVPPWKSNDLKSWIWMQQAMHPELNYNAGFKKKWFQWKLPFGNGSIKKWLKEMKQKRKEEKRLQKAEVHAAVSIAGLAAALAAIAEETSKEQLEYQPSPARKAALASAAALVASQCTSVAESMGTKRDQLSSVIGSAMSATSTSDILTLTAAATTSLRGAATLKERVGCRNRLNSTPLVLPIQLDGKFDDDFDFEKRRLALAKGTILTIETYDGKCITRVVSLHLNSEAKVILQIMKRNVLNVIASKKECLVLDLHAELYKDSGGGEYDTCYQIVLTTARGMIKLDMADDYQRYRMWASTISEMMTLSTSLTKYELQFCKY